MFYTKTNSYGVQVEETRICVVMVGLPARGKSLIAQKGILTIQSLRLCSIATDPLYPTQSPDTLVGCQYRQRSSM